MDGGSRLIDQDTADDATMVAPSLRQVLIFDAGDGSALVIRWHKCKKRFDRYYGQCARENSAQDQRKYYTHGFTTSLFVARLSRVRTVQQ